MGNALVEIIGDDDKVLHDMRLMRITEKNNLTTCFCYLTTYKIVVILTLFVIYLFFDITANMIRGKIGSL